MADPLSISASIAGLISLADIVYSKSIKYWKAAKNAEKDVKSLADQVSMLAGTLKRLVMLADALSDDEFFDANLRMHHISACGHTLHSIKEKLRKAELDFAKPDALSRIQRKLKWPFSADEMKELFADLARHQSYIQIALTADTMNGVLRLLARQEDLEAAAAKISTDVKKTLDICVRVEVDTRRQKVLDHFMKSTVNPQPSFDMSLQLRHPLTGMWIRHSPDFQNWLNVPQSHVWLNGMPGAGKTVLAGTVIEDALQCSSERVGVAYFYCIHQNEDTKLPANVLGALASQIALQKDEAFEVLLRYYDELRPGNRLVRNPTVKGLVEAFEQMSEFYDQLLLVTDGLDECGESTDAVLSALLSLSAIPNCSVAILSRDERNIREGLEAFTEIEIEAKTRDVELYVAGEMETRSRLRNLNPKLKEEILQSLKGGADGMFRWVTCQLDYLCELTTDKKRREALKKLPPNLPKSYLRILKNVPESQGDLVEMVLHFIAFAEPQLTVDQLCEAVSVSRDEDVLDRDDHVPSEEITRACSSLLRKSKDGQHLQFAHFSVRQFLQSNFSSDPTVARYHITQAHAQRLLATQCLLILQASNFRRPPLSIPREIEDVERRLMEFPLYGYATMYWMKYGRDHARDPDVSRLSDSLFDSGDRGIFTAWATSLCIQIYEFCEEEDEDVDEAFSKHALVAKVHDKTFGPLRLASLLALPEVCASLLGRADWLGGDKKRKLLLSDTVSGPESLISGFSAAAAAEGTYAEAFKKIRQSIGLLSLSTHETVKLILDAHVVALDDGNQNRIVSDAILRSTVDIGYLEVAAALITARGNVDNADVQAFTKITELASDQDRIKTGTALKSLISAVNPLVSASADASKLCTLAWQWAITLALEFARDPFFVDTSISLSQESLVKTAWSAVRNNEPNMLAKALQDPRLAASELADEEGWSLLTFAVSLGSHEVVKILIDAGCEVSYKDTTGWLPLNIWAGLKSSTEVEQEEKRQILDLLIEQGASTSTQDVDGDNVWHMIFRDLAALELLIQKVDPSHIKEGLLVVNEDGYTPATYSLLRGEKHSILLLIQHCSDDPSYWQTPQPIFGLAAAVGDGEVIQQLVSKGLKPDEIQEDSPTPLHKLHTSADLVCVQGLKAMHPGACEHRYRDRLPLETFTLDCIFHESDGEDSPLLLDLSVLEELLEPGVAASVNGRGWVLWEAMSMSVAARLHDVEEYSRLQEHAANALFVFLVEKGVMEAYETATKTSGLIPLLGALGLELPDPVVLDSPKPGRARYTRPGEEKKELVYPIRPETLLQVLKATRHWDDARDTPQVVSLLHVALHHFKQSKSFADLTRYLLENGVSPSRRVARISPLEQVVKSGSIDHDCFRFMMDSVDKSLLNELNPSEKRGLIHFMVFQRDVDMSFMLEHLLDLGADPNLRKGTPPFTPALGYFLENGHAKFADVLLRRGADINIACADGRDAALSAAYGGDVSFLKKLASSDTYSVNWQKTCSYKDHRNLVPDETRQYEGMNALHVAAFNGHEDVVAFYLDRKLLDIHSTSEASWTALHYAANGGDGKVIELLCKRGADVNARNSRKNLPLHIAVVRNALNAVEALLRHGSEQSQGADGMTPYMLANMARLNPKIISQLSAYHQLQRPTSRLGTEDAVVQKARLSLLDLAIRRDDLQACKEMIAQGCPLDSDRCKLFGGEQPLILALQLERLDIVDLLLRSGAATTVTSRFLQDEATPVTALEASLRRRSFNPMLPYILEKDLAVGSSWLRRPFNPLALAVRARNEEAMFTIIEKLTASKKKYARVFRVPPDMVIPELINQRHTTPNGFTTLLHCAVFWGSLTSVRMLLDMGAPVDTLSDSSGETPLGSAARSKTEASTDILDLLVSRGAPIDIKDKHGLNPLMHSCSNGDEKKVALLLEANADHTTRTYNSQNALHLAMSGAGKADERAGIVLRLMRKGLNTVDLDEQQQSPLHFATKFDELSSFVLNGDLGVEDFPQFPYHYWTQAQPVSRPWLTSKFRLFRRRIPEERFKQLVRHEPGKPWSPLCRMAAMGFYKAVDNILTLGEDPDFIGSPVGTALTAACESGQEETAKLLVRRGASLHVIQDGRNFSAIKAALPFKRLLQWILVGRHWDQRLLEAPGEVGDDEVSGKLDIRPWSGVTQMRLRLIGELERKDGVSMEDYFENLTNWKKAMRGKIVPPWMVASLEEPEKPPSVVRISSPPSDDERWSRAPHSPSRSASPVESFVSSDVGSEAVFVLEKDTSFATRTGRMNLAEEDIEWTRPFYTPQLSVLRRHGRSKRGLA